MGIQDLQTLIENEGISVDLFRIGRNHTGGFRLIVDAEGCLDRLYGGYFSGELISSSCRLQIRSNFDKFDFDFRLGLWRTVGAMRSILRIPEERPGRTSGVGLHLFQRHASDDSGWDDSVASRSMGPTASRQQTPDQQRKTFI